MESFIPLATDLMGTKIKTLDNEEIGVVQNIMIDPQNGTIIYLVLCYANFMGKVHHYFAIAREMLATKYDQNVNSYLEITKADLMDAKPLTLNGKLVYYIGNDTQRIYEFIPKKPQLARSLA